MDNFVVSARKYRPSTFRSVIGQDSITTTLKNAIKHNHLAQAFLFCGPRGVGKTTCARILAKTINCTNLTDETESCNECESCRSFNEGKSLNIYELDAASNNSVDDIRNLVEQVRYPPHSGDYKIYIIDEVHMLSASAFNAFLKTLEEPPPYAIFILATTEKHKIIPTILSRCQIFDFNRIMIDDISKHLQWISEQEGISSDTEALHLIAQKADGALRDALSIFDQIVSFDGSAVTYQNVIDNLHLLDYDYYFRMTDAVMSGMYSKALLILEEIAVQGFDLHHFVNGMASHFRDLLVSKDPETIKLLEVGPSIRERYLRQSRSMDARHLFKLLDIANRCDTGFKASQNQRLFVEVALLQMSALVNQNGTSGSETLKPDNKTVVKESQKKNDEDEPASLKKPVQSQSDAGKAGEQKEPAGRSPSIQPKVTAPSPIKVNSPEKPEPGQKKRMTISIKDRLLGNDDDSDDSPDLSKLPKDNFTELKMQELWIEYANNCKSEGRHQFATTLTMSKPAKVSDLQIEFPVTNSVQQAEVQDNLEKMAAFLQKGLNNYHILINCVVMETPAEEAKPYTTSEKFQRMAEKNPDMNQLRQQFDLDFD
jgi:DNA polymerase-3 subunit gamma/tau